MPTNTERRQQINQLNMQLRADLVDLERKFKENKAALEKKCRMDVAAIEREIKESRAEELRAAQEQVRKILEISGLDLTTVMASLPKERGPMKPSTVLHHGPDGKVWNGRGRMPGWFRERHSQPG